MKRVSFSLAETYEADVIKKYQHLKKCSFSAAIKECLKLGAPVLNRINENIAAITDIEISYVSFLMRNHLCNGQSLK